MKSWNAVLLPAFCSLVLLLAAARSIADSSVCPPSIAVSDSNTSITFEVGTTWHTVRGTTRTLVGRVWLENPADYRTIRGDVHLPVKTFDTDNSSRDEELRSVMDESKFPEVRVEIKDAGDICPPQVLEEGKRCDSTMRALLTIRGVSREITLPYTAASDGANYLVSGSVEFSWKDFGVKDPSIFIARVHDAVRIAYSFRFARCSVK